MRQQAEEFTLMRSCLDQCVRGIKETLCSMWKYELLSGAAGNTSNRRREAFRGSSGDVSLYESVFCVFFRESLLTSCASVCVPQFRSGLESFLCVCVCAGPEPGVCVFLRGNPPPTSGSVLYIFRVE